jgi:DNA-binding IclR family transcriptional regulator
MSAYALRACVLLRLQARKGEWVPLPDLVSHLGAHEERVRNVCEQLVDDGTAHRAQHRYRGELYGIGVEGVMP